MEQDLQYEHMTMDCDLSFLDDILSDDSTYFQSDLNSFEDLDFQVSHDVPTQVRSTITRNTYKSSNTTKPKRRAIRKEVDTTRGQKMINPSRERRKSEIQFLRGQLHQLKNKFDELTLGVSSSADTLCSNAFGSSNLWQSIAQRQKEAVQLARLENINLWAKLQNQAKWIQSLQDLMCDQNYLQEPQSTTTNRTMPPFQATKLLPSTSPNRDMLLRQLHQAVRQLQSVMVDEELGKISFPKQTLKMDQSPNSSLLKIIGTTYHILPVSVHEAIQAIWKNYNMHNVGGDIPNSSRAFLQLAAKGNMNIRHGVRVVEGDMVAQYEIDKSKASIVFEYVSTFQTLFGPVFTVRVTSWTVVQSNSDKSESDKPKEEPQAIIRWCTRCLLISKINGVQRKLPNVISQKIFENYKLSQQIVTQQIENILLDTMRKENKISAIHSY